ncbi:MAG: M23 family metallopeptidase [Leptospiraceae bacterium]|nr:M23 family metallopeptidase [Leptospiraceae bacterium]
MAKSSNNGKQKPPRKRSAARSNTGKHLETEIPGVDDYAHYLRDDTAASSREPLKGLSSRWKELKNRLADFLQEVHIRGKERLTIMVIPHTEKKTLNLHVSLYTISISVLTLGLVLTISIISLVGKRGGDTRYYDMGLTNSQFNLQSVKMAEEIIPLHQLINRYTNTISDLYVKLDDDEHNVMGQGGVAQHVVDDEIENLQELIQRCREQGEDCDQDLTEEILRRVLYISEQDNHNLRRSVEISEKILAELNTREKQNLLENTPGIWPTHGYLLSPYGWQTDAFEGREVFRRGIEIGALPGTEVYATAPGEIEDIRFDEQYGLQILVRHRFGIQTYYAHLDRTRVRKGDQVERGQVIGHVGKSGIAPVYKLYYEVHVGSVAYNPHAFLNHMQDQWLIQPKT